MKKILVCLGAIVTLFSCGNEKKLTKESVTQNVTREHQMLYAWSLNAILNQENGASNFLFAGEEKDHPYQQDYINGLKEWWDISNASDCKESIGLLMEGQMHHAAFNKDYEGFYSISEAEFQDMLKADPKYNTLDKLIWKNKAFYQKKGIIAWDLIRAIGVMAWGRNAGYITEDESYDYALEISKKIQKNFDSFEEMSENYLAGYLYWSLDENKYMQRERTAENLLSSSESPWNIFPFDYDMSRKEM